MMATTTTQSFATTAATGERHTHARNNIYSIASSSSGGEPAMIHLQFIYDTYTRTTSTLWYYYYVARQALISDLIVGSEQETTTTTVTLPASTQYLSIEYTEREEKKRSEDGNTQQIAPRTTFFMMISSTSILPVSEWTTERRKEGREIKGRLHSTYDHSAILRFHSPCQLDTTTIRRENGRDRRTPRARRSYDTTTTTTTTTTTRCDGWDTTSHHHHDTSSRCGSFRACVRACVRAWVQYQQCTSHRSH